MKDPKLAKKWLAAAQTLVQKGDYFTRAKKADDAKTQYENAVTAFEKAIEAGDDNAVYFSLALVEEKLGQLANAYHHCKQVIDPKANVKPDVVKKAQAKLDELSAKIGTVALTIVPEGTQVMIAGKTVGESPMTEPLVLDPGSYTLSFAAVGYQPKDIAINIEAGSESERKVALEPVKVVTKPEDEQPTEQLPEAPLIPKSHDKRPLYYGAGATGGFVLIATITGIAAISKHGTFTDPKSSEKVQRDAQSSGRTLAHITDLCLLGAVGAAAFTAYWYVYRYAPEGATEEAKVGLAPWVQPGAGGVFASGSF